MSKVINVRDYEWGNLPEGAVYIGRGSKYGNPFRIGPDGTRDEVCEKYAEMIEADPERKEGFAKELRGKDLACFCSPKRCHGDYLLKISSETPNG